MVKLKIYIFRHGQTDFNRDNKFTGFIDAKLTKSGVNDSKIIALRLKAKRIDVAFSSTLKRARDTLDEVLKYHPECKKIIYDNRMIERGYGKLQGKTHFDVVKKFGFEKYDLWHRGFDKRPPAGESFADVEKRVRDFIKDLLIFMAKEKVNVAISAHGNSIRLFKKIMDKSSKNEAVGWFIPYDNYYEYEVDV